MARDTTPSGRKRPRLSESEDVSISSSHKKRRLNGGSASAQSTPRGLHAIASAISGALAFGRRSASSAFRSNNKEDIDKSYEVPDSDEEREARVKRAAKTPTKKQVSSSQKSNRARKATYDVPNSGDELGVVSPTQRSQERASNQPSRRNASDSGTRSSSGRRARKLIQGNEDEAESQREDDHEMAETPSKRQSGRKARSKHSTDSELVDLLEPADDIVMQDTSLAAQKSSGRKRRNPLDDLVIDGTPRLKGILTPSKRHQEISRTRKSVAFDRDGEKDGEEIYFADLPTKAGKTKKGTKTVQEVSAAEDEPEAEAEEDHEDVDDEEDEEVCAICSKLDSEPPNEIILCDNCDFAVHQDCYGVPVIPEGDWLCKSCSQEDIGLGLASGGANGHINGFVEEKTPEIPNFEHHLRSLQRVLLDRCTGSRCIPLRGQDEAYEKAFQLIQQTVAAGEGNSMLIIGARGCGKTTLVESIISTVSKDHKDEFHVVRLNGFIHTDDKLALKEIWRQLGKEMEVEDELVSKPNNYADILASLLALLSHPSEISEAQQSVTSKSVIFIIDEFDLFATHARQTLLYNLFDIAQSRKAPIAVLGLTTRVDVVESLEKRVKSRFSHRYVYLSLPKSLPAYWDICKQGLTVQDEDLRDAGFNASMKGHSQFHEWWNKKIDALYKDAAFQEHMEFHFYKSKSVSAFLTTCILPLSHLSPASPTLKIPSGAGLLPSLEPPDSKLHLLESLSDLDLAMLIAAARLDIVAHTDTVNFAMAYDEYTSLMGKQRVQSASAGMLAVGAGSRVWGRGAAGMAWERLASLSLLIPAGIGGRAASSHGGLEARMWKVDVALEEIPAAVKLNAVLARWCKEI